MASRVAHIIYIYKHYIHRTHLLTSPTKYIYIWRVNHIIYIVHHATYLLTSPEKYMWRISKPHQSMTRCPAGDRRCEKNHGWGHWRDGILPTDISEDKCVCWIPRLVLYPSGKATWLWKEPLFIGNIIELNPPFSTAVCLFLYVCWRVYVSRLAMCSHFTWHEDLNTLD